jgi:hypothetical protein
MSKSIVYSVEYHLEGQSDKRRIERDSCDMFASVDGNIPPMITELNKGDRVYIFSNVAIVDSVFVSVNELRISNVGTQILVKHLPHDDRLQFISDSQDTQEFKGMYPAAMNHDSFFVEMKTDSGELDIFQVWGMDGIIPYMGKTAYKIA